MNTEETNNTQKRKPRPQINRFQHYKDLFARTHGKDKFFIIRVYRLDTAELDLHSEKASTVQKQKTKLLLKKQEELLLHTLPKPQLLHLTNIPVSFFIEQLKGDISYNTNIVFGIVLDAATVPEHVKESQDLYEETYAEYYNLYQTMKEVNHALNDELNTV